MHGVNHDTLRAHVWVYRKSIDCTTTTYWDGPAKEKKEPKILIWSHLSCTRFTLWSPAVENLHRWTNHKFVSGCCNPSWQHNPMCAYLRIFFSSSSLAFESAVFELRAASYTIHTVLGIIRCERECVMVAGLLFCSPLHLFSSFCIILFRANGGAHAPSTIPFHSIRYLCIGCKTYRHVCAAWQLFV